MKRLISVNDIRSLYEQGQKEFYQDDDTVITPAARDAATEFGVKIIKGRLPYGVGNPDSYPISSGASPIVAAGASVVKSDAVSPATKCPPVPGYRSDQPLYTSPWPDVIPRTNCSVRTQNTPSSYTTPWPKANPIAREALVNVDPVRTAQSPFNAGAPSPIQPITSVSCGGFTPQNQAVPAAVTPCSAANIAPAAPAAPAAAGVDPQLVAQIVQQVLAGLGECPQGNLDRVIDPGTGFMLIKSANAPLEVFNDGTNDRPGIYIKEFTNPQESPNMTSGIMEFDNSSLDWTLTYDEMDYVIDGTLEFIVNGQRFTGHAGDSFYIPANTHVTFTTPNKAKFFFVTYPANWAETCGLK
ncbi:MAG: cupin domain-containing protein [Bacillota bacterium]